MGLVADMTRHSTTFCRSTDTQRFPSFPEWIDTRPFLSSNYLFEGKTRQSKEKVDRQDVVQVLDPKIQEVIMIEELLNVMVGIEGQYITIGQCKQLNAGANPIPSNNLGSIQSIEFVVTQELNSSITDIVRRMLPLGIKYLRICEYIDTHSRYEYGMVNHAFCAALKTLVKVCALFKTSASI